MLLPSTVHPFTQSSKLEEVLNGKQTAPREWTNKTLQDTTLNCTASFHFLKSPLVSFTKPIQGNSSKLNISHNCSKC